MIAIGAALISTTAVNNANAASTQVAGAQTELTSIPPTLDAIATNVKSSQNFADSLQLAARAQDTYNTGDPFLGLSLALEASRIDASPRTEQILSDLAYQPGPRRRFIGHGDSVNSVAFSPDGQLAISGSDDATMILWDIETGAIVYHFEGLPGNVTSVAYSPDGKTVVSGGYFGELILWDVATHDRLRMFEGHTEQINSIAYSPDGQFVISGSSDNTLVLWDLASDNPIRSFEGHTNAIKSVAFSHDGQSIASGDFDHIQDFRSTR